MISQITNNGHSLREVIFEDKFSPSYTPLASFLVGGFCPHHCPLS